MILEKQLTTEITENTELYQSVMHVSCITRQVMPMTSIMSCFCELGDKSPIPAYPVSLCSPCSPWLR